jgi:hypothetical protein
MEMKRVAIIALVLGCSSSQPGSGGPDGSVDSGTSDTLGSMPDGNGLSSVTTANSMPITCRACIRSLPASKLIERSHRSLVPCRGWLLAELS